MSQACSGGTMLIITPVPRSKPACVTRFGQTWACQWYWPGVLVRCGVEAEVEGDVAERGVEVTEGVAQRDADRRQALVGGVLEVALVMPGHDEHLVRARRSSTER